MEIYNIKIKNLFQIEISGRIQYENHVLLLEPQNVKVLGGNVEDIASLDYMLHLIEEDM